MSVLQQNNPYMSEDMNENKRNCVLGIPRYHENLFQIIRDNHEWLAETEPHNVKNKTVKSFRRKIKTPEDLSRINKIVEDLRTVKSELFIDPTFHKKPRYVSIPNYISEFLRIKGIFNYYTFTNWYRITIFPESGDPECVADGEKREMLLIPLYIRLKKNKTYEQLKSIHYSSTGYEVKPVNANHFLRDDSGKVQGIDEDSDKPQGYDSVTNPKFIVDYDNFEN